MTKKDVLKYFNPDMSEAELDEKLDEVQEEQQQTTQQDQANQPVFGGLSSLG